MWLFHKTIEDMKKLSEKGDAKAVSAITKEHMASAKYFAGELGVLKDNIDNYYLAMRNLANYSDSDHQRDITNAENYLNKITRLLNKIYKSGR